VIARVDCMIGSKSILVLDDEFDVMNIIKLGLQKKGSFEVYGFTDPVLALEHFKANVEQYSLVISDIRMPKMNGYEFIKEVKKIKPNIKVFFMTAFEINEQEFSRILPDMKINEFIQKPVSIESLVESVQSHISSRKSRL
jgi:DNA-binding NtrC family response regulator